VSHSRFSDHQQRLGKGSAHTWYNSPAICQ